MDNADGVGGAVLALTCKALLQLASRHNFQVPDQKRHIANWEVCEVPKTEGNDTTNTGTGADIAIRMNVGNVTGTGIVIEIFPCSLLADLQRRYPPRDSKGRESRAWNLCVGCMSYLPRRKSYWDAQWEELEGSRKAWWGSTKVIWDASVRWFGDGAKVQCSAQGVGWESMTVERQI